LSAKAAAASAVAAPLASASATSLAVVVKWIGLGALGGLMISATATEVGRRASDDDVGAARPREVAPFSTVQPREASRPAPTSAWSSPEQQQSGSSDPATAVEATEPPPSGAQVRALGPLPRSGARLRPSGEAAPITNAAPAQESASSGARAVESEPTASESAAERALREEVAALALAKSSLNRGAATAALDAVRAYRVLYPAGRLAPEATYIEMEAALLSGDRARAERIAERLATGTTPSAKRAREILQGR
jgi:TolA-binding protein